MMEVYHAVETEATLEIVEINVRRAGDSHVHDLAPRRRSLEYQRAGVPTAAIWGEEE